MRVALDVSLLDDPVAATGNRPYIRELARALQMRTDLDLVLIGGRRALDQFPEDEYFRVSRINIAASGGRVSRTLGNHLWLPGATRRAKADVLHCPSQTLPLLGMLPLGFPTVLTLFDFRYRVNPSDYSTAQLLYKRLTHRNSIRRATALVAISQFTKARAIEYCGIDADKVGVSWLAAAPEFRPRAVDAFASLSRYRLDPGYLLAIGNLAHKQPDLAIRSLAEINTGGERRTLALLGTSGSREEELRRLAESLSVSNHVKYLGYVPDADLPELFAAASVFLFPSLYEGFGIPLVEAMASGIPIVASGADAIREVLGPAGIVVEDARPVAIASAIRRLLDNNPYRHSVVEAGLKRAKDFSWQRTAAATIATYYAAAG